MALSGLAMRTICGNADVRQYTLAPLGAGMSTKNYPSRALIVDDEPHVRALLHDFLATVCDEVATAASGEEALEIVPMFQPDVILTDMMMPGMSGPDLLDALRGAGVTVPVILISGTSIPVAEGFFGLLGKPFNLDKLAQVVKAALDHGRTEGA